MRRLRHFVLEYKLFFLALLTIIVALILEILKKKTAANWLLAGVSILELLPILYDMWQDFRMGKYGIDILAATAVISAIALKQYWAGIVVILMLTGGKALEDFAEHRAKSELDALLKRAPQTANVIRKNKVLTVKVDEIHVGDKVLIKAGELVPVDSIIIEGSASFDESSLTGESLPQAKDLNDKLLSGSINIDGPVTAKALASAEDSQYQQIIKLVRGAAASQAPFVRLADRYSIPFTILAFAIAGTVWFVSGQAIRFLEVIIVATPCPLLLAAPIALISGMARMSRYGIIVRTGSALEKLAEAETIAFDKTGTLTKGVLAVEAVNTYGDFNSDEVIGLAAGLEQNSNHVVALAIVNYAKENKVKLSKAKNIQEIAGRGLLANMKGRSVVIGRLSLLKEHEVDLPKDFKSSSVDQTATYVAIGGQLAGVIRFVDELRPESKATLIKLGKLGIKETIMVTGDNQTTANAIAKELGIKHVFADTLPGDKINVLADTKARPLVFVGDGVNDAPILTAADVGIALGARGSTAASESADMVIMQDDLGRVAVALKIAQRTFSIAKQAILIGIGLSLALMIAFSTGKFPPLAGALLQEVVDVFVIFYALRAHLIKADLN